MRKILSLVLIECLAILICSCRESSVQGKPRGVLVPGDKINEALRRCHEDSGKYPSDLSGLVPEYLDQIPQAEWGTREWQYETFASGEGYRLWVFQRKDDYVGCYYESGSDGWYYDH